MKKVLLIILLLLVVLGIAAGVGVWKVRHLADSKLLIKEETIFTLKPGTGRLALGEQLYADKIINRPRVFQWLLRIEPDLSHFKAGTYRFTPQMTVREMLKLLESGKEAQFPLRLVEGMRLSDYWKTRSGLKVGSGQTPGCIPPIPPMSRYSSERTRKW